MKVYAVKRGNTFFDHINDMWIEELDDGCIFTNHFVASSFAYSLYEAEVITYKLVEEKR